MVVVPAVAVAVAVAVMRGRAGTRLSLEKARQHEQWVGRLFARYHLQAFHQHGNNPLIQVTSGGRPARRNLVCWCSRHLWRRCLDGWMRRRRRRRFCLRLWQLLLLRLLLRLLRLLLLLLLRLLLWLLRLRLLLLRRSRMFLGLSIELVGRVLYTHFVGGGTS